MEPVCSKIDPRRPDVRAPKCGPNVTGVGELEFCGMKRILGLYYLMCDFKLTRS